MIHEHVMHGYDTHGTVFFLYSSFYNHIGHIVYT